MSEDLRALLIPPQEARLRSRFGLNGVPLKLITSGWHRLVVVAPDRVFVFPRHKGEVPMLEREADVLSSLDVDFAPRLLGLHRDDGVSPYPFLELTRILGKPYDVVEASLPDEERAEYLEERGATLPEWRCVNLFWCLIDATMLQSSGCADASWEKVLADLSEATRDLL
jgi:hypothetical protein